MTGKSYVQGTDRISNVTYGNPSTWGTNNGNPRILRVFKGDTVTFSFRLQNWDPFPVGGMVHTQFRSIDFTGGDNLVSDEGRKMWVGLLDTQEWYLNKDTVVLNGPGSDTPGKQFCEYVQTNPTVVDLINPLSLALNGGVTLGLHKFNTNPDWIIFPLSVLQGVPFYVGDVMSCAEIAYSYNLVPSITLGTPAESTISATPAVDQTASSVNATYTQPTEWQISQFTLPSSSGYPDVTQSNTASNRLCSNFFATDSRYRANGCRTVAQSSGGNTIFNTDGSFRSGSSFPSSLSFPAPASIPAGHVVCYVLSVNAYAPYMSNPSWRHSKTVCASSTKEPKIQVLGGDVRVGRYFNGDSDDGTARSAGIYTSTTTLPVTGVAGVSNAVFGSWTEYGSFAPGPIVNFASLSGYVGGFPMSSPTMLNGCPKEVNRLTFANTGTTHCGDLKQSMGLIPDVVAALRSWTPEVDNNVGSALQLGAASAPGMYKNTDNTAGGITIGTSEIASGAGRTYIVYAPNKTVTIAGNITIKDYATQEYGSIRDIPQLVIIAKNIFIHESVKRIDAWLIAHGGGSDGVINTCVGYTPPFSGRVCTDQLYINGPVMARQLLPWRTATYSGSCAITSETVLASGCAANSVAHPNTVGQPAEIINLPASSLLWAISQTNPNRIQTTYTTELPPFF